ncbi:RNA 2',3'-cyclic phosphodiesterase [Pararhodospirillum photometricum]|uniref:RNA 2',3'-cyclic phosphodiesterase n=1 Tax=Pararhodospirillum photometricum DSM 122 TaxID=1150469 RepID=H6SJD0_PARPM|nr:RNA 2',3'-cyclic phosphodiesterase [Pararhodospirillum photometricum]CCG08095.1 2',5' RNA ligase [Pararhodospirillum photometricum DSM 122]
MIRLFIGLGLPDAERARLGGLAVGMPGVRWMPPASLHLTVRFLGETEEGLAREIDTALQTLRAPPVPVRLEGLGVFGKGARRHTLWAGVAASPELGLLKGRVDAALRDLGLEADSRAFTPHVTLARMTRPHEERLQQFIEGHSLEVAGGFVAPAFVLYSSHLGHEAPHYREEAVYPLQG